MALRAKQLQLQLINHDHIKKVHLCLQFAFFNSDSQFVCIFVAGGLQVSEKQVKELLQSLIIVRLVPSLCHFQRLDMMTHFSLLYIDVTKEVWHVEWQNVFGSQCHEFHDLFFYLKAEIQSFGSTVLCGWPASRFSYRIIDLLGRGHL